MVLTVERPFEIKLKAVNYVEIITDQKGMCFPKQGLKFCPCILLRGSQGEKNTEGCYCLALCYILVQFCFASVFGYRFRVVILPLLFLKKF